MAGRTLIRDKMLSRPEERFAAAVRTASEDQRQDPDNDQKPYDEDDSDRSTDEFEHDPNLR